MPTAVKDFRRRYRTRFEGDPTKSAIYRGVSEGLAPAGVEFYQPLFFEATATLFDYLPRNAVIVQDAALPEALARSWHGDRDALRGPPPRHRAPAAAARRSCSSSRRS